MQELLKKAEEMDALYRAAKAMEYTFESRANDTIRSMLSEFTKAFPAAELRQLKPFTISCNSRVACFLHSQPYPHWVIQVINFKSVVTFIQDEDGEWDTKEGMSTEVKMATAETMMDFWKLVMHNVGTHIAERVKTKMKTQQDEVKRMLAFLQESESFLQKRG